jgi:uncharacterized protein YkwD
MRLPVLAALVLAAVLAPCAKAAGHAKRASDRCPNADVAPGQASVQALQAGTLCLVNAERAARGLQPLRAQNALARAAGSFARQMGVLKFFDHTSPSGTTILSRVQSSGYLRRASHWLLAENIGWGSGSQATPRAAVQAWMTSPGHRRNLLSPRFAEIGIGIVQGAPQSLCAGAVAGIYVGDFGRRKRA